jgi:N-acetyl-beta-hexosaminidase
MIDQRVFPRVYALAEQMWSMMEKRSFDEFHIAVKSQFPRLSILGVQYGPALRSEVADTYSWE